MTTPSTGPGYRFVKRFCAVCRTKLVFTRHRDINRKKFCTQHCRRRAARCNLWNYGGAKSAAFKPKYCPLCTKAFTPDHTTAKWCKTCCPSVAARRVIYNYGLSYPQYQALIKKQGGGCAICRRKFKKLYVDHDHSCCSGRKTCGKCVRGLLCCRCNLQLGVAETSSTLENMRRYLNVKR